MSTVEHASGEPRQVEEARLCDGAIIMFVSPPDSRAREQAVPPAPEQAVLPAPEQADGPDLLVNGIIKPGVYELSSSVEQQLQIVSGMAVLVGQEKNPVTRITLGSTPVKIRVIDVCHFRSAFPSDAVRFDEPSADEGAAVVLEKGGARDVGDSAKNAAGLLEDGGVAEAAADAGASVPQTGERDAMNVLRRSVEEFES